MAPLTEAEKLKNQQATADEAKKKAQKLNPLINAVTDPYVDDHQAYVPVITDKDRDKYFEALEANNGVHERKLPPGRSEDEEEDKDINVAYYQTVLTRSFGSTSSTHREL